MNEFMRVLAMPSMQANVHTTEWHIQRRLGIGGSDAAAVLGESRWKTPYEIWRVKTGRDEGDETNNAIEAGIAFEPAIRKLYSTKTGRTVYDPGFAQHEKYKYIVGNVDGICDDRILEVKNSRYEWDAVPTEYYFQVQHYMFLHDKPLADIAVMFSGQDFRIFTIERDIKLWEYIIPIYEDFWKCVESDTPPELTTLSDVNTAYKNSKDTSIILSDDTISEIERLRQIRASIAELEAEKAQCEMQIKSELKENAVGTDASGKTLVTWRTTKPRTTFDTSRLKNENPELYQQYLTTGNTSRTFLLK